MGAWLRTTSPTASQARVGRLVLMDGSSETWGKAAPGPGPGSSSAAIRRLPTVRKAKIEAVWPVVAVGRAELFFLSLERITDQCSTSSSSRYACAEASLASLRCAAQQYCWSATLRSSPIFLPHKKHSIQILWPDITSPILTAGTRSEAVLREESLGATRILEAGSKVYH